MTKLKIISQYKYLILIFITIIYVFYITNNLIYKTNFKEGEILLTGIVVSIDKNEDKTNLIIKAKEKIKVIYYNNIDLSLGDLVKIEGTLNLINNNTLFNMFNYRKYLMSQKIYFNLSARKIEKIRDNKNIFYKFKNIIYEKIENLESKDYLKTFVLGDNNINQTIKKIYQENGITHLLAISGMHISLLSNILDKILKKIKCRHLLISLFLIFYSFLTNFTPSVIRSVCFFIFDKIDKKKLIILVCSILLIYNPYYIYNTGFLFSFIISFYLIIFKDKLNNSNYLIKIFLTSLISFLASIPILINNFYSINILSPIINLFFVPFISIIIFPLSLLTLIFPFLDNILVLFINILEISSIFINKFNINLTMMKMSFIIFIFYYIIITLVIMRPKYFYLLMIIIIFHNNIKLFNNSISVTMIDVGQGDSILIEDKRKHILIDTGGVFNNNIVVNKTIPYLESLGIKKIDYLILTHGDYDHMGEAINLVNNFKVEKVIFNCGPYNDLENELIKVLDKKKIKHYSCIKELNIDDNKLYFLNNKEYGNENDNSSVIYTKLNNYKFLFMGDAGVEVEKDLIEKYYLQNIDVLKVGHHGSKTSSGRNFVDNINPKYSIISVGKNNRYAHPNKEVLDNLKDSKIYRTDQDGSVMFKIKNNKLEIDTCSP